MNTIHRLLPVAVILAFGIGCFAQEYHVRIGTIGNSITQGSGLPDPETQAYPMQLGALLPEVYGDTCIVRNFGLTTTTMLKNGDVSYWDTQQLKDYLAYAPEICFILLGTNDSKPQNWDVYGNEYYDDYLALIDTIKQRNPFTRFMLGYPPPAFNVEWGIRDSVIVNGIIPAIDSVLDTTGAEYVDFHAALMDSVHLFPDKIHPNVKGAEAMARIILNRMIETAIIPQAVTGLTFITKLGTGISPLRQNDSTELSWTTLNAGSVFLNGEPVDAYGSIWVSPSDTAEYIMIATGEKSADTVWLTLPVYIPQVTKLKISPLKAYDYPGDTVLLKLQYLDQYNRLIDSPGVEVQWSIAEGSGALYNPTGQSVNFISGSPDTSRVMVSFGELSFTATVITRKPVTGLNSMDEALHYRIFPNPAHGILNVELSFPEGSVSLKIIDMKGGTHFSQKYRARLAAMQSIIIPLKGIPDGQYLLTLETAKGVCAEKIIIQRN